MSKIHIGKKIKEIVDKSSLTVVDFAEKISLTRNGAYKIFEKEAIDTAQLHTISRVLEHDFFTYYNPLSQVKENKADYGYATKAELAELTSAVLQLTKVVERIQEQLPKKRVAAKKKYGKK